MYNFLLYISKKRIGNIKKEGMSADLQNGGLQGEGLQYNTGAASSKANCVLSQYVSGNIEFIFFDIFTLRCINKYWCNMVSYYMVSD